LDGCTQDNSGINRKDNEKDEILEEELKEKSFPFRPIGIL